MDYKVLRKNCYRKEEYKILPIRMEDMEPIRLWRNSQLEVLRQKKILSQKDQEVYFSNVVQPLFNQENPPQILFSLFKDSQIIGYGGLVHISWVDKRAEVSFLVDTKRTLDKEQYKEDFFAFMAMMKEVAFNELKFHRLTGETYSFRNYHISLMEKMGFVEEGRMRDHIFENGSYYDALVHGMINSEAQNSAVQQKNVLITSISKKIPLINAVRKGLNKVGLNIQLYGGDISDRCLGKYFVDVFWEMPKLSDLTPDELLAYCKSNNIGLIIPTRDGELSYFASIKDYLSESGVIVMVSDKKYLKECLDKFAFSQLSKVKAIPTALDIESLKVDRYVVKERYGAGSKSIGINLTKLEALEHAETLYEPIFQPYLSGTEVSVDAYITSTGFVKGIIMRRRELVIEGESKVTSTFRDEVLENIFSEIIESLKLSGHIILQAFIGEDNDVHVIECNARFGGASTLSLKAGLDSFYWAYLESQGVSIDGYPFTISPKEIKQVRHPQDFYI